MSCLGPNYNPIPTREWYRFENVCAHSNNSNNSNNSNQSKNNSIIWNGKFYPLSDLKKGNVLQYKKNSANITKQQRYAQIAKGKWTNRTTTWASQTETYTNPNVGSLKRICYSNIITNKGQLANTSSCLNSYQPTDLPLTCDKYIKTSFHSLPINKNVSNKITQNMPMPFNKNNNNINNYSGVLPKTINTHNNANVKSQNDVIPNGGMLIYNITENICTGQIYSITEPQNCFPSTCSNIPGPAVYLCYNSNLPTYYPRKRTTYSQGGKWPEGEKAFFYTNDENAQNCENE